MNNITEETHAKLQSLSKVTKFVLPLMWYMYVNTVRKQKKYYDVMLDETDVALPFHTEKDVATNKLGLNYYVEATFVLQNYRDFQLKGSMDGVPVYILTLEFNARRAVLGYVEGGQQIEKIVLEGDSFPNIQLYTPFRVNVQMMTDCFVTSFWLNNLDLAKPMPLPEKHIWCTRNYKYGAVMALDILPWDESSDIISQDEQEQQEQESEEQALEENWIASVEQKSVDAESNEIKLSSLVVYNGFIYQ